MNINNSDSYILKPFGPSIAKVTINAKIDDNIFDVYSN